MSEKSNISNKEYTSDQTIRDTIVVTTNGVKVFADRLLTIDKEPLTGIVKSYKKEKLTSIEKYKNGQLYGTTEYYYSNGNLFITIEFKSDPKSPDIGHKHGNYTTYEENGEIEEIRFYKNNKETRPRKNYSKKLPQPENTRKSEKVRYDNSKKSYEWSFESNNDLTTKPTKKSPDKKRGLKIDINNLFKSWVIGAISLSIIITIISRVIHYQNDKIKTSNKEYNTTERNYSSNYINLNEAIIIPSESIEKTKTKATKGNKKISPSAKPMYTQIKTDTVEVFEDTLAINIDTLKSELYSELDSTAALILKLFQEKEQEKNIYRAIRKELKNTHDIKLSSKEIKLIVENSTAEKIN